MKTSFPVILTVLIVASVSVVPAGETPPDPLEEAILHTTVERVSSPPVSPEEMGKTTAESDARVGALHAKLCEGRQHPKPGSPMTSIDFSPALLVPNNPSADSQMTDGPLAGPELFVNTHPSAAAPSGYRSEVHEPAVAASGDRVFYTANWYAAASSNGGTNFNFVNPSSGPFSAPTGESFCCDQTMAHDPGTNTIFWLQQYGPSSFSNPATDTGTQRINVDQNADGTWDCSYDINTVLVGFNTNTWFDYPDLVVSENYLYHSSNAFTFNFGWVGGYAGRYPLAELAACTTPLSIDAFRSNNGSFRFSRGAGTTMYFASHFSNSAMRIWSWSDGASAPTASLKTIAPWSDGNHACAGPDGREWCGRHDARIQGGFIVGDTVGFMWTPSQGGGFAFPYVRISTFDAGNGLDQVDDIDLWSPDHAFMYPAVAVNADGQLGGTIMWGGGGTDHASCSAWVVDEPDTTGFVPFEHTLSIAGNYGVYNGDGRSGDYTLSNVYYPDDTQFIGACFAYPTLGYGTSTYIRFGRTLSGELFIDGFESGNTDAWN